MYVLYDAIIFGFLTIDFAAIIVFIIQFIRFREKLFTWIPIGVFLFLLFSGAVVFYGSFIEPKRIVVTEQTINIPTSNANKSTISIALVADFHVGPYKNASFVKKAVGKINSLNPDLILIAGDSLYGEQYDVSQLDPLKNFSAPLGVFAVLGNHDYEEDFARIDGPDFSWNERTKAVKNKLEALNITVLINQSAPVGAVAPVGAALMPHLLGGVDELWTGRADVKKTFEPRIAGQNAAKILLAHNPDIIHEAVKNNIDLVLAAHTHGGQIRLPFWGPVPRLPTKLGKKYAQGLFQFQNTQLFITRGLGETGPRARLFAPPEIALLTINFQPQAP